MSLEDPFFAFLIYRDTAEDIGLNLMSWKLRFSMAGTVALIVAVSTLGFSMIMSFMGVLNLYTLAVVVVIFNIAQWLFAPYIINHLYGVRPFEAGESPELHRMIDKLSQHSGISTPRLMFSKIPIIGMFNCLAKVTAFFTTI